MKQSFKLCLVTFFLVAGVLTAFLFFAECCHGFDRATADRTFADGYRIKGFDAFYSATPQGK